MILIAPGGIGNQLFTIAAALQLSENSNIKISIFSDNKELVDRFLRIKSESSFPNCVKMFASHRRGLLISKVSTKLALLCNQSKVLQKVLGEKVVIIDSAWEFPFHLSNDSLKKIWVLLGFFQDKRLIENLSSVSREFMGKLLGIEVQKPLLHNAQSSEIIGVHIRRGDYLAIPDYGVLTERYFVRAIQSLSTAESKIVLACDDSETLRKLGSFKNQLLLYPESNSPLSTMALLAKSQFFIMSNSTFSFWVGWAVKQHGGSVYSPKPWFKRVKLPNDFLALDGFIMLESEFE